MPDIAMCPSTVCPLREKCIRNWDAKVYKSDRDPKLQEWAETNDKNGQRLNKGHTIWCALFLPVSWQVAYEVECKRHAVTQGLLEHSQNALTAISDVVRRFA